MPGQGKKRGRTSRPDDEVITAAWLSSHTIRNAYMYGIARLLMVSSIAETATVTSKSMVTIPSSIRRKYGIKNGDKVQFVEVEGVVMMIPVKSLPEMHGLDKQHAKALIEGIRELNREHRKEARE